MFCDFQTNNAFLKTNVNNASTFLSQNLADNGLLAREGRETNALNCKPNTNLKEKVEV
jgi:hypothetical protein